MSRWIDAEKELKELKDMKVKGEVFTTAVNFAIRVIEEAPSIDIVRCRECKHQWREHKVCAHEANVVEGVCGKRAEDNDFCSYGEREGE